MINYLFGDYINFELIKLIQFYKGAAENCEMSKTLLNSIFANFAEF
jgi:hypothetical protein